MAAGERQSSDGGEQASEEPAIAFEPGEFAPGSASMIEDLSGLTWSPIFRNRCSFDPSQFASVMMNMIRNPNVNTSWLFRADILFEGGPDPSHVPENSEHPPRLVQMRDFEMDKVLVRRLIPRNALRDQPMDQTCLLYHARGPGEPERSLVVYNPHVSSESEVPFYHPKVRGLAFLHEWHPTTNEGAVSIHYCLFGDKKPSTKLVRTALNLLSVLHKHGQGRTRGYQKRVHHDTIIPQIPIQTTYAKLKEKYARELIDSWAETTDPTKHVFEDLGIAAFLIELWRQIYRHGTFPGFVDIGCGNGLLVYVLNQEGYPGWGFDARVRRSWEKYGRASNLATQSSRPSLGQHVLLPSIIAKRGSGSQGEDEILDLESEALIHDGRFPQGTFIISNHADELTPWTPILATGSQCPFIMIPCCSHDLTGAKFRAPAPKQRDQSDSVYSSLVHWVAGIASDCGWEVETEMLRIPSTRNTCLVGRTRTQEYSSVDLQDIIGKYGGAEGYAANVMKLVKQGPRSH